LVPQAPPPAGGQPGDHPPQRIQAGRNVHEHCCVCEIERAWRERLRADVVSKDFDVRGVYRAQKSQLQVGSDHASGRSDHTG
jgi:hypothetical protein